MVNEANTLNPHAKCPQGHMRPLRCGLLSLSKVYNGFVPSESCDCFMMQSSVRRHTGWRHDLNFDSRTIPDIHLSAPFFVLCVF